MSLRAFHLLFIAISVALAFGFGIWCLHNESTAAGVASFIVGAGLVAYLFWFLRKTKKLSHAPFAIAASMLGLCNLPRAASACAVCFGDPKSPLTQSANSGILLLLVVISSLLMTFAGIFFCWTKRARALSKIELS